MPTTHMYPVTPTGRWGKERAVTADMLSYNAHYARLRVTDERGRAFVVNLPRDLCAEMVTRIDRFRTTVPEGRRTWARPG